MQKSQDSQKKTNLNQIQSANDVIKRQSEQMKALMDLMKQTEETANFAKKTIELSKKAKAESKKTKSDDKAKAVIDSFTEAATETASKILVKQGIAGEP